MRQTVIAPDRLDLHAEARQRFPFAQARGHCHIRCRMTPVESHDSLLAVDIDCR